jgi:hypothetical protein
MIADHKGYAETVELLLVAGADVATKASCVPTPPLPLHLPHAPSSTRLPSTQPHPPVLSTPKRSLQCSESKTAADIAADAGHADIARILQQ